MLRENINFQSVNMSLLTRYETKDEIRKALNTNSAQIKYDIQIIKEWLKQQRWLPQNQAIGVETKEEIRGSFSTSKERIQTDVDLLREWLKKQYHLPQNQDDELLECLLMRNKFNVERTKRKLDNYYTIKGLYPIHFQVADLVPSKLNPLIFASFNLTPDHERVIVVKSHRTNGVFDVMNYAKMCTALSEILMRDYAKSYILIYDLVDFGMEDFKVFKPAVFGRNFKIVKEAFSVRVSANNVINMPPFYVSIYNIVKTFLPSKQIERTRFLANAEVLKTILPVECLPNEYGGTQGSIKDIMVEWDHIFLENKSLLEATLKNVSKESLRIGKSKIRDEFGLDGTFRQLVID